MCDRVRRERVKVKVKGFRIDVGVLRTRGSDCGPLPHGAPAIPHAEDLEKCMSMGRWFHRRQLAGS